SSISPSKACSNSGEPLLSPFSASRAWIWAVISYMPSSTTETYDVVGSRNGASERRATRSWAACSSSELRRKWISIRSPLCPSSVVRALAPCSERCSSWNVPTAEASRSLRSPSARARHGSQRMRNIWWSTLHPSRVSGTRGSCMGGPPRTETHHCTAHSPAGIVIAREEQAGGGANLSQKWGLAGALCLGTLSACGGRTASAPPAGAAGLRNVAVRVAPVAAQDVAYKIQALGSL